MSASCLALTLGTGAGAQEVTAATLVDRLQIQDLITRYYNNFGRENAENFVQVITQGKEYSTFVKVDGRWRYKTRQIVAGTEPPAGWKE